MLKRLLLLALLGLSGGAFAQALEIEDVITQQLQAFNDRNIAGAWVHASPTIKGIFSTPENFARMVENGYPMVWDNSNAQFLSQEDVGVGIMQEVQIMGPDGVLYILDYLMIETPTGWQINGVDVVPAPQQMS